MDLRLNDVVELKKQHPCGSKSWKILRTGADFRLQCTLCGHKVMVPRTKLEKSIKKVTRMEEPER
ncbi:MAG: DUF951 domain-containing protein [Clostridia bacterium]